MNGTPEGHNVIMYICGSDKATHKQMARLEHNVITRCWRPLEDEGLGHTKQGRPNRHRGGKPKIYIKVNTESKQKKIQIDTALDKSVSMWW